MQQFELAWLSSFTSITVGRLPGNSSSFIHFRRDQKRYHLLLHSKFTMGILTWSDCRWILLLCKSYSGWIIQWGDLLSGLIRVSWTPNCGSSLFSYRGNYSVKDIWRAFSYSRTAIAQAQSVHIVCGRGALWYLTVGLGETAPNIEATDELFKTQVHATLGIIKTLVLHLCCELN